MTLPQGYTESTGDPTGEDDCVILQRPIYGLVQSARQYWKKFVRVLKEKGFRRSESDPCLLCRKTKEGMVYLCMYVDDILCVGTPEAIQMAITDIREDFELTVDGTLTDYLGCEINFSSDGKAAWLGQPHLMKNLKSKFEGFVKSSKSVKTPGTPGFKSQKPMNDEEKLKPAEQKLYRSGIGMLNYLVKHSRPDLASPVRELSKTMDCATSFQLKELFRIIKHTLEHEFLGLKIAPNFKKGELLWILRGLCDSDWGNDKESRKSVTGYIIYLLGVAIAWKSKGQSTVALSSTEAEYYALSEIVMEIKYIVQLLEFMEIPVQYPVEVYVDNVGAIYLSKNATSTNRTKHIDSRFHFVRDYQEDGKVAVKFVRSDDNDADLFTKNVSGELYDKHSRKMIGYKQDIVDIK